MRKSREMPMRKQQLEKTIEQMRRKLLQTAEKSGLSADVTIDLSKELDTLLNTYTCDENNASQD